MGNNMNWKEKYNAVEKAMYILRMSGYTIKDNVYMALIKERAFLERIKSRNDDDSHLFI